jgi:hypothetical protein
LQNSFKERLIHIPILARVALTLACAQRAAIVLSEKSAIHALAICALKDAWTWEIRNNVPAKRLYDYIHSLFALEHLLEGQVRSKSGLFSLISAIYYTTWHAVKLQSSDADPFPNDMTEVDDDYVLKCLEYSAQAATDPLQETHWQDEILDRLFTDFKVNDPNILGLPVLPDYFELENITFR